MAQQEQADANAQLAAAQREREEAQNQAEAAATASVRARQGTVLEQEGSRILRRFDNLKSPDRVGQLDQLIAATQTGRKLQTLVSPGTKLVDYAALSPIYTLNQLLQGIRERNQFSHGAEVLSVAFSPDGSQILTGSSDGTATLWSRQGEQIAQFSHGDAVWSVAFSPDGSQILTGSLDGTATLWSVPTLEGLLARSCNWLRNYLTHNPDISNEDRALCGIPPREGE